MDRMDVCARRSRPALLVATCCLSLAATACGGGGGGAGGANPTPPPAGAFTVGGAVSGLTGTGLNLRNNGRDDLAIVADGLFSFVTTVASGGAYAVTVRTHPTGQKCTVASGAGTVAAAAVTNVAVTCASRSSTPIGFVYLPHYGSGLHAISQFWMDETGELHALSPASVDPGGLALGGTAVIAADPTGRHLYAAADAVGVLHYTIGADGTLSPQEVTTTAYPYASQVGIHPSGRWAYVASTDNTPGRNSQIDLHAVGPDGALSTLPVATVVTGRGLQFVLDPSGQHAYDAGTVVNPDTGVDSTRVRTHVIQDDGTWSGDLTPFYKQLNAGPPILDPLDRFACFSAYQLQDRYTVAADGRLAQAGTFDLGGAFGYLSFHPSGDYAFATRTSDNAVVQLTVGAGGALTSQGSIPAYGQSIGGAAVDPTGRFVYVQTQPFGYAVRALAQFTVDARGQLIPMAVSNAFTGHGGWQTTSIVIVPAP